MNVLTGYILHNHKATFQKTHKLNNQKETLCYSLKKLDF